MEVRKRRNIVDLLKQTTMTKKQSKIIESRKKFGNLRDVEMIEMKV